MTRDGIALTLRQETIAQSPSTKTLPQRRLSLIKLQTSKRYRKQTHHNYHTEENGSQHPEALGDTRQALGPTGPTVAFWGELRGSRITWLYSSMNLSANHEFFGLGARTNFTTQSDSSYRWPSCAAINSAAYELMEENLSASR